MFAVLTELAVRAILAALVAALLVEVVLVAAMLVVAMLVVAMLVAAMLVAAMLVVVALGADFMGWAKLTADTDKHSHQLICCKAT